MGFKSAKFGHDVVSTDKLIDSYLVKRFYGFGLGPVKKLLVYLKLPIPGIHRPERIRAFFFEIPDKLGSGPDTFQYFRPDIFDQL